MDLTNITELDIIYLIFSFILGSIFGSFLNVLIERLPRKMSIIYPNSHCFNCNKPIKWYDNIPIFSYIFLKGKCRYCKKSYSSRYFLIEIFTAIMYVLSYIKWGYSFLTLTSWIVISCLIVIFFIDLKHFIIPDSMIVGLIIIGILCIFIKNGISIKSKIIGIIIVIILSIIITLFEKILKKELLGFGDIKLFFTLSLLLGYENLLIGIFLSALVALITETIILKNKRTLIPYGPYISVIYIVLLFFGKEILNLYLQLFI